MVSQPQNTTENMANEANKALWYLIKYGLSKSEQHYLHELLPILKLYDHHRHNGHSFEPPSCML